MKTRVLFTALLLLLGVTASFAQKIKKREIDKFTKSEIIITSTETLFTQTKAREYLKFEFNIKRTNEKYTLGANIYLGSIEKYDENSGVVLLLDNGEQLFLETLYTGLGSTMYGSGSFIFSTVFELSNEEVEILKAHKITDIRIKYFGGHYDRSLKSNKQVLIMKMLNLFE